MGSRLQLDAQSFEKLLAAAYVVQQELDRLGTHLASDDSDRITAIAETQVAVQRERLSLVETMQMIVLKAVSLSRGTGAAIWSRQGEDLICKAVAGKAISKAGESTPLASNLLAPCFQSGEILLCEDTRRDPRATFEALPQPAGGSLIAVPIHHESQVEAALEVFFAEPRGWQEVDVRTCQVLAGIVTQCMTRGAEQEWRQALAAERATLLSALEKIQPHLQKLLAQPPESLAPPLPTVPDSDSFSEQGGVKRLGKFLLSEQEKRAAALNSALKTTREGGTTPVEAWRLPHELLQEPGLSEATSHREIQSALSLALHPAPPQAVVDHDDAEFEPAIEAEHFSPAGNDPAHVTALVYDAQRHPSLEPAVDIPEHAEVWDIETQPFEQTQTGWRQFWSSHWADVCLGVSATILLGVMIWVFLPGSTAASPNVSAAPRPSTPQLTTMERVLVSLGLAEPPPRPVMSGNPETQVWVDLHTALYYCPGTPEFGATKKGKRIPQKQAQLEHFEPAARRPCP